MIRGNWYQMQRRDPTKFSGRNSDYSTLNSNIVNLKDTHYSLASCFICKKFLTNGEYKFDCNWCVLNDRSKCFYKIIKENN